MGHHAGAAAILLCVACTPTEDGDSTTSATTTSESTATGSDSEAESTSAADVTSSTAEPDSTSSSGDESSSTGVATCPDVEFVYNIAHDPTPGNACVEMLGDTNTCAVTQTECELSWGCNGALENLLPVGPIDAAGVYVGEGEFMGTPVVCTLMFDPEPYAFEFDCSGRGLSCTGGGF